MSADQKPDTFGIPPAEYQRRSLQNDWKCGNEFAPYHWQASHVEPAYRYGWNDCYTAAQAKIAALEAELHEQARQNGMGSEREARLMARVAELEKDAARWRHVRANGDPTENISYRPDWTPAMSDECVDVAIAAQERD